MKPLYRYLPIIFFGWKIIKAVYKSFEDKKELFNIKMKQLFFKYME